MNVWSGLVLGLGLMVSGTCYGSDWDYTTHGPAGWDKLRPEYSRCGDGQNQSPINLSNAVSGMLSAPQLNYSASIGKVVDNGHALQWTPQESMGLTIDNTAYTLQQIHFHVPSEHLLNGISFPAEVHLVHKDKAGKLLVIGVFLKTGNANAFIDNMLSGLNASDATKLHPLALLPKDKKVMRYSGSLTTPPCTEGVKWVVMQEVMTLSPEQFSALSEIHKGNARPVQDHNARLVLKQL